MCGRCTFFTFHFFILSPLSPLVLFDLPVSYFDSWPSSPSCSFFSSPPLLHHLPSSQRFLNWLTLLLILFPTFFPSSTSFNSFLLCSFLVFPNLPLLKILSACSPVSFVCPPPWLLWQMDLCSCTFRQICSAIFSLPEKTSRCVHISLLPIWIFVYLILFCISLIYFYASVTSICISLERISHFLQSIFLVVAARKCGT